MQKDYTLEVQSFSNKLEKLGDIATAIYRGAGIKRDEVTETGIPCVRYGEIYTRYNTWFERFERGCCIKPQ